MQNSIKDCGRPLGSTSSDAEMAQAFGHVLRYQRKERGISQEQLANLARVERSHMGKIERGEHMPSMPIIVRISNALQMKTSVLIDEMEMRIEVDKMMKNLRQT